MTERTYGPHQHRYTPTIMARAKINFDHQVDSLAADIRRLLFEDWDPSRVNHNDYMIGSYDDHIPTIYKLIVFGHPVEEIYAQLNFIEKGDLRLVPRKDVNRQIAEKLFDLGVARRGTGIARLMARPPVLPAFA